MKNNLVSVLVHTHNSSRTIRSLLQSIKEQSYNNIEIIVVDNYSNDETLAIAKKYTKNIYVYGPERSAQRNYAAKVAHGSYYLVPDSDMVLDKDVISECVNAINSDNQIKMIVIPEDSFGTGYWAQCKALERSFYVGIKWMEGARFFDKNVFWKLGGYDEKNTGTEDFDLPQRIIDKYGQNSLSRIESMIHHDEGAIVLTNLLKKKLYYAQKLHRYIKYNRKYYDKQSNLLQRYALYFSKPSLIFQKPHIFVGMIFMKTAEFAAGWVGFHLSRYAYAK